MTILVRTSDVPVGERTELWRAAASEAYVPLDMQLADPATFRGQIRTQVFGETVVGEVTADAHRARHGPHLVARHELTPYCKISMPVRGHCTVLQDGRQAVLTDSVFAMYDTSRPYQVVFEDTCLADNVVDLVATVFAERDDGRLPTAQRSLLLRVKSFVETHLDDTDLTPDAVAAATHISTGYLHKLFRTENTTVSTWTRARRLERCRRDLTDPAYAELPVSTVGAHWGSSTPRTSAGCSRRSTGYHRASTARQEMCTQRQVTPRVRRAS